VKVDIAIVGGSLVGGSLACALSGSGLRIAVIEPRPATRLPGSGFDQRVYALNPRSRKFLDDHGIWRRVAAQRTAPVHEMLVFGDDGASSLEFSAYRNGVPELAVIVEESNLQQAVTAALAAAGNALVLNGVGCEQVEWCDSHAELTLSNGDRLEAALVVAADGAESKTRAAAGMQTSVHEYGQQGVVANFAATLAHGNAARQWFRDDGVLALLPLPENQVTMVWSAVDAYAQELLGMSGEQLAALVQLASANAIGELRATSAARAFPLRRMHAKNLIGPRLALVGDAAHNVHPLAGQGLNLGFGDAEALARVLMDRGMESDCGAVSLLRRYERRRKGDVLAMEHVTDGLQALFGSRIPGVSALRNAGLKVTDRLLPLKRFLVKHALG
jgi:2-octaprenylphenol hydroxylase